MNHQRLAMAILLCLLLSPFAPAQERGGRGARGGDQPTTAKARAPIDLTGYWTAVITEDWHTRMLTAPRGDFGSGPPGAIINPNSGPIGAGDNPSSQGNIPYNVKGAQAALKWDPAKDEAEGNSCKAYGAPGVMRQPTHLHVTWQDDNTLKIEADYGTQTRLLHFGPAPSAGEPTLQGSSAASWTIIGGRGFERGGSLKVVTTHLKPGYYVLTEYFRTMKLPDGSTWIRLTQLVDDPEYLAQPYIVNYQFKKLPDGSLWNPAPCSAK
ncbi:MAG: hypothetical protein DMG15_09405 [Acidobacteria bacterium]|nr:MAG: hypothetical protein DMG15_09405 [Acidobacteriota bacterium]